MKLSTRHIAFIALIAFMYNALVPFFAVYDVQHPSITKEKSTFFGDKVLICTGEGFKWVKWSDLQKGKQDFPPSHYKCPLCYIAAHGLKYLFLLAALFLIFPRKRPGTRFTAYPYQPTAFFLQSLFCSRAPPLATA